MMAGRFVLENEKGEVVRTFNVRTENLFVIYRHDLHRVEVVGETDSLSEAGVPFDVLRKTTSSSIMKRSVSLSNGGRFRFTSEIGKTANLVQLADDSEDQAMAIYKYTALIQLSAAAAVLVAGLIIEPLLFKKPEDPIITVIPQRIIQQPPVQPIVKPTEAKVVPPKKVAVKPVEKPVVKPEVKRLPTPVKTVRKENAPLRTKIRVEKVGALGVLGGMQNGSKNSAGFNMNALNDSKGTSWNGAGSGGVGGMERAIPGKGLVSSAMGNGGKVIGGGGYGTRGKAGGGRPGYGEMNMGGTASSYFQPVEEEAIVEGGLTKDQIAAVINRHIGEILYCYEKGLQVAPKLAGRVGVKFVINGGGIVSTASIANSSLNSAQVEGCIINRLRSWPFPKPVGGVNVRVTYPFVLKRVGHG